MNAPQKISIIGDGGWGTALGLLLHKKSLPVHIWGPIPEVIAEIKACRENRRYLPGVALPAGIIWTAEPETAAADADLVIFAVPSKYCREVFKRFQGCLPPSVPFLSVIKGLDQSGRRISELIAETFSGHPLAVLSGPSLASEVARGMPTAVVVAGPELHAAQIQKLLMSPHFRVYTSPDVIGVELGGALKNIIAIAAGVSDGLGFGDNTRAALITRGLAEITRLGCALGAAPQTFAGLSGMGDLIATCTSRASRNHYVGEQLGKGLTLPQILSDMQQVAEGVTTCSIAREIGRRLEVPTPIIDEVHALLRSEKTPAAAMRSLLERAARPEHSDGHETHKDQRKKV